MKSAALHITARQYNSCMVFEQKRLKELFDGSRVLPAQMVDVECSNITLSAALAAFQDGLMIDNRLITT